MIRELNFNDYEEFLNLISTFRETYFSKEEFKNILDKMKNNMTKIFVYEHEKKIIGTVKLLIETKFIFNISYVGHIEDICVYKEYRNKNIGKNLINKCVDICKSFNCYKVICVCSSDVKNFYLKCNFEERGHFMSKLI